MDINFLLLNKKLKFGFPKGSLQKHTLAVFERAGFSIKIPERSYLVKIDDPEIEGFLIRPQEIPRYIKRGQLDAGITGEDLLLEFFKKEKSIIEVCPLRYGTQIKGKWKWVLAVPMDSKIKRVQDLKGKVIATESVNLVKDYLRKKRVKAKVEFSWGATEVKPPIFADAIADIVETGTTLGAHNLKIIDTILESSAVLITGKKAWEDKWKRKKIKELAILLQGAVNGEEAVNLMMRVPKEKLRRALRVLPRLKSPTVRKIAGENWYDVSASCKTKETRELIPKLKRMSCEGIVEYPLNKVIP